MNKAEKVAHKYFCLFENRNYYELIYVHFEDTDGYIHFEYCNDGTKQVYKMNKTQLINNYERLH